MENYLTIYHYEYYKLH